jgi:hypothetical protein
MKRRGFSLAELSVSIGIIALTTFSITSLLLFGLRSMQRTTADVNNNQKGAQGMRRVAETLRSAMSTSISNDGRTITYTLPKVSNSLDAVTGEREFVIPKVSDGVSRMFYVTTSGSLIDSVTGRTLIKNIQLTDPDPNSSQYNQNYAPFSVVTLGSQKGITINLITSESVLGKLRYSRLKTTVLSHNQ